MYEMPMLDIGDCYMRTIERGDYRGIFEYGSDEEVTRFLSWGPMKSPGEAKNVIANYYFQRPSKGLPIGYAIVHKKDNKMIGVIDYHTIDRSSMCGEIGYVLNRNYWGMGIMTRALKKMVEVGFDYLNLQRIEIKHVTSNKASQKVIEKVDFRYEGTLRKKIYDSKTHFHRDVMVYSILRSEYLKGELAWQSLR